MPLIINVKDNDDNNNPIVMFRISKIFRSIRFKYFVNKLNIKQTNNIVKIPKIIVKYS
mgnify:CR=1 FL=1